MGDGSAATATLSGLICDDYAECRNPAYVEDGITASSFAKFVRDKIVAMREKIESRSAGGQGTLDVALIGASSLPVWKMLSVAANMPGGDFVAENHTQLVAVDVAYAYFTNLAKTLREAVQNETGKGNADVAEAAKSILMRVTEIEQEGARHAGRRISEGHAGGPDATQHPVARSVAQSRAADQHLPVDDGVQSIGR